MQPSHKIELHSVTSPLFQFLDAAGPAKVIEKM